MSFESTANSIGSPMSVAPRPPRMPGPVSDIDNVMDRAAGLCNRVQALVECLVGSAPTEAGVGSAREMPVGLFGELADKAHYLERRISDAERALERVEKVVL